jgi:hypothetical protein
LDNWPGYLAQFVLAGVPILKKGTKGIVFGTNFLEIQDKTPELFLLLSFFPAYFS